MPTPRPLEKISTKTIDFELARFFLALDKSLDKPQLLPYLRKQILNDAEYHYANLTDEEVRTWLSRKK